jgi:nucleoid-associated protein YgaU
MAKGLAPVFFTACGVVVAGVAGYAVFESQSSVGKPVSVVSETVSGAGLSDKTVQEETEQETAKLDLSQDDTSSNSTIEPDAKSEAPAAPIEVVPVKPSFGLVRVERDGSAVIAGEGPANELVQLIEGAKVLSEATANTAGEFVFVLDEPLAPGAHELFLRVIPKEGEPSLSSSFAFVDVPKPKTIGEVTVLLAEAGKPSQILQKPAAQPEEKIVTATAQSKITLANPEDKSEAKVETDNAEIKTTEVSALAPVLIEAADVENGKIFIAGTGEPLTSINIYLENELLGTAQVAENGAFLFEGSSALKPGRYDIRADMTKGGASVLARAEVTLVHEPEVVADIPQAEPKEEIASVETQEQPAQEEEPVGQVEETKVDSEAEQTTSSTTPDALENKEPIQSDKKEIQTGSAVIIRRGDSLWTVARRNYGAGIRYTTIFEANRDQVRDPNRIYPGQVLKVPESAQESQ